LVNHNLLFTGSYAGISAPDMFHQSVLNRLMSLNFNKQSDTAADEVGAVGGGESVDTTGADAGAATL